MKRTTWLIVLALVACSKKEKEMPAEDKGVAKTKADDKMAPPPAGGPFDEFGTTDEALKKWQGAWVVETGSLGHFEAWQIKGNQLTAFDGKAEQTLEFVVRTPCSAKVVKKEGGGTSSTTATFVFEGDTLHTGMGDAGIKKGDKILACGSGKVFVWDGKKCLAYEESMFGDGKWESKETECKLEGDKFVAKRPGMDMTSTLVVAGNVLMSEQMKGNKVEKATDLADAKAKLAARK